MSRASLGVAAGLMFVVAAAWPSHAQAYLTPQVDAEITLAEEQFNAGSPDGARTHLTNAKQLADQLGDWEGMLIISIFYFLLGDVWEMEDAYSLGLQFAYDLANRDQTGPNAGANCLEGRHGIESGVLVYDVVYEGAFTPGEAPDLELRYQRDHYQTNLDKMNQTPCPP